MAKSIGIYEVFYNYYRGGRWVADGSVSLFAESAPDAANGFLITHPDGSNFSYTVTGVSLPTYNL
jgi:hypothetical protein